MFEGEKLSGNTAKRDLLEGDDAAVQAQVERICSSDEFRKSPKLQQFLTYLVDEFLAGRSDQIKGFNVAQDVFGRSDIDDANTSTIVSVEARRLRRKLSDFYADEGKFDPIIISVPKGAYVPKIEFSNDQNDTIAPAEVALNQATKNAPRSTNLVRMGVVSLTIVILLGGWFFHSKWLGTPNEAIFDDKPTLAVVPFSNLTGTANSDSIANDLAQGIITDLSVLREIDVIAFSSIRRSAEASMTPPEIGETFDATHALQGTLKSNGSLTRINVELFETKTGKLVWADRFDVSGAIDFTTSDLISKDVVAHMPVQFIDGLPLQSHSSQDASPEAVALFEQGMEIANSPRNAERLVLAEQTFQLAIAADANYVGGHAGLAYIKSFKALFGHSENPTATAHEALDLADKAFDIDANFALALHAKAFSHLVLRDFSAALEESKLAVKFAPNDPYAHSYHAFILCAAGFPQEAIPFAERALRLDPLEPRTPYLNILGVVQFFAEDYVAALASFMANDARRGPNSNGHKAFIVATYAALDKKDEASELALQLPDGFVEKIWSTWFKRLFKNSDSFALATRNVGDAMARR